MPIRTILFPTDFSDIASNALEFAASWASKLDAELILLHVNSQTFTSPAREAGTVPQGTVNNRMVNSRLESLLQDMVTRFGIRTRTHIEEGQPGDMIPKVATETQSQLIVMGSAGPSGYAQVFGSNLTVKVMTDTRLPLLIIPQEAEYQPLHRWAYASDLEGPEEAVVDSIIELASQLEARLELVHVKQEKELEKSKGFVLDNIRRRHSESYLRCQIVEDSNILQGIDQYVERKQPDLLIMVRHDHSFWARLFNRDKVAYSAARTNFPMLVLHAERGLQAVTGEGVPAGEV